MIERTAPVLLTDRRYGYVRNFTTKPLDILPPHTPTIIPFIVTEAIERFTAGPPAVARLSDASSSSLFSTAPVAGDDDSKRLVSVSLPCLVSMLSRLSSVAVARLLPSIPKASLGALRRCGRCLLLGFALRRLPLRRFFGYFKRSKILRPGACRKQLRAQKKYISIKTQHTSARN